MYFEDEKENMKDNSLDDLAIDLDDENDDKSITWDDLLSDDADIDLGNAKKKVSGGDFSLDDDDLSLLEDNPEDDELLDIKKAPPPSRKPKRKDAFDVFGGDKEVLRANKDADDDLIQKDGLRNQGGDTITPDLTSGRTSARKKAQINNDEEDDDIYFEPKSARKSSGFLPVLVGIVVACLFVGAVAYVFLAYGRSVSGLDLASLIKKPGIQEQTQTAEPVESPVVDPNDPASAFDTDKDKQKEEDAIEEKKKAEQKLVTLAVQNAGRANPFVPPAGFEASKVVSTTDYELLSPPETIPDDSIANEAKKLMNITVSGILYDSVKSSAIINMNNTDYYVQIGDMIDNFQIVGINKQYVAIKDGTNIYKAQVGESFNNNIPGGMAIRQSSGAKRYTSPSDVEVSVKDN